MDDKERRELIRKLFAIITGKLEDAAGAAAEGQGANLDHQQILQLSSQICSASEEVAILAEVTSAFAADD